MRSNRKNLYEYHPILNPTISGNKNTQWKGDNVGYIQLHAWVRRRLKKPLVCPSCGLDKKLDLANISDEYKRDLNDWEWLCRKCHMVKDGRMSNLKVGREIELSDINCLGCGKLFHPKNKDMKCCSKICRGKDTFNKTISKFTSEQLKDIAQLPYSKVYKKYKITQGVIFKIKQKVNPYLFQT